MTGARLWTAVGSAIALTMAALTSVVPVPAGPQRSLPHVGEYSAAQFAGAAASAPADLATALEDQLGISVAEFYAEGAASADAAAVITALKSAGVDVRGTRMDGTRLIVNVSTAADADLVASTGASPVFDAPDASPDDSAVFSAQTADPSLTSGLHGGQGYYLLSPTTHSCGSGSGTCRDVRDCSVGFNGYRTSTGAAQFVTAGHCDDPIASGGFWATAAYTMGSAARDPGTAGAKNSTKIGAPIAGSFHYGDYYDSGLVQLSKAVATRPDVITWGGGANTAMGTAAIPIVGAAQSIVGTAVCRSGQRTGWQCGKITVVDYAPLVSGKRVDGVQTTACSQAGDSGGPFIAGQFALGILSGGTWPQDASHPTTGCLRPIGNYSSLYFQLTSQVSSTTVHSQQPDWQLAVSLPTPTVTRASSTLLSGTVAANRGSGAAQVDRIHVTIDGKALSVAPVSNGTWSVPVSSKGVTSYTYTVQGASSDPLYSCSRSATRSGTFRSVFAASTAPTITGEMRVGRTVTAKTGTWSPRPTFRYQWYSNGKAIKGATTATLVLTAALRGHRVSVNVAGTRTGYVSKSYTSPARAVAYGEFTKTATPTITGAATMGKTLTAHAGNWGPGKAKVAYTWYADGKRIAGANTTTLRLAAAQRGKRITVTISVTEAGFHSKSATSKATARVR